MKFIVAIALFAALGSFPQFAFGLMQEYFGDTPISPNPNWPNGTEALINLSPRVYSIWVNGNEKFYYEGDVQALNSFLKSFAAIKIPVHQLVVDTEWIAAKNRFGGNVRYDWMLSIPSGIYREHIIKEKGTDANEQYPSMHLSAGSEINFDRVIIPATIALMLPQEKDKNAYHLAIDAIYRAHQWSKAMTRWTEFVDAKAPSRQWIEIKSELITKWLPGYRVFIFESSHSTFALDKTGTIFDVGSGEWSTNDDVPCRNEKLARFLKKNNFKIADGNTAVSMAKLVEELSFTADTVAFIKYNTKNFSLFDKRFYEMVFDREKNWKYLPEKKKGYWQIIHEYVGPPACIGGVQQWRLVVDANNVLSDVYLF